MVQIGNRIIVGGKFTTVTAAASAGGATVTRNGIFAYNATTGVIDPTFVPNVGTKEVTEVVDAGDGTVFIGGLFANVNGAAKTGNVARINATTGAVVTTFKSPKFNAGIADMQLINNKLYVGGSLHHRRGSAPHPPGRAEPDHRRRHGHPRPDVLRHLERRLARPQALRHLR